MKGSRYTTSLIDFYISVCANRFNAKAYYICGVARPFNWFNNFHLAFEYSKGDIVSVRRMGIEVLIEDAKEIPIVFNKELCTHVKAKVKSYYTCRNWQFANIFREKFGRV